MTQMQIRNDLFRRNVLTRPQKNGIVNFTRGFVGLPIGIQQQIIKKIRNFSEFNSGNDPHKEHDFGSVQIEGHPKVFWKIDYYPDATCEFDPDSDWGADEKDFWTAYRIMTVMLAEEY